MNPREFLINRQKGIGGSDVAAIMGVSPWKTPLDIYLEKIQPIPEDIDLSKQQNRLKRGKRLEKYILEEYAERTNQVLEEGKEIIHPDYPFLKGNIDAYVKDDFIIVEAKSSGGIPSSWEDEIPLYYKTQAAYYAMLASCDKVDIPVLFTGWNYECFTYDRDFDFEDQILQACLKFWNEHVLKKIPPEPLNLKDVQSLYPISKETSCESTDAVYKDVQTLGRVLTLKRRLIEREEALKLRICKHMKNHGMLMDGDKTIVTWKTQKRSTLNAEQFKLEHPDLYSQYKKDSTSRVFRLKGCVTC
jgi:putative phage-type endonuclease